VDKGAALRGREDPARAVPAERVEVFEVVRARRQAARAAGSEEVPPVAAADSAAVLVVAAEHPEQEPARRPEVALSATAAVLVGAGRPAGAGGTSRSSRLRS
jgi:hypothetical protein